MVSLILCRVPPAGEISGLTPGEHGFHIHAKGRTGDQCREAGGHFNPFGASHGSPGSRLRHVGDLGNIQADSTGLALVDITMPADKIRCGNLPLG